MPLLAASLSQDVCSPLIVMLVALGLSLIRFVGLWVMQKGETPMTLGSKSILFVGSFIETAWTMLGNYIVGTWQSPIAHKSPSK